MKISYHHSLYVILATLATLSFSSAYGQAYTQYQTTGNQGSAIRYSLDPEAREIEGSPFVNDEWQPAEITYTNGKSIELDQVKYDARMNELVFLFDDNKYIVPELDKITSFTIGETPFITAFDTKNKYSVFEVLTAGENFMLLRRYWCSVLKGEPSKGYTPGVPDKYVLKDEIYVKQAEQNAIEINPRKGKQLLEIAEEHEQALSAYIKVNKLRMKSVEDLKAAITFLNTL